MRVVLGAAGVVALAVAMTGCADDSPGVPVAADAGVNYGSFGTRADIDCGAGKSLTVSGSNNTLTVIGSCSSVTITGADNTLTLQRVDGELAVAGLNNTVRYRSGDPTVTDTGSNNRIGRA